MYSVSRFSLCLCPPLRLHLGEVDGRCRDRQGVQVGRSEHSPREVDVVQGGLETCGADSLQRKYAKKSRCRNRS